MDFVDERMQMQKWIYWKIRGEEAKIINNTLFKLIEKLVGT